MSFNGCMLTPSSPERTGRKVPAVSNYEDNSVIVTTEFEDYRRHAFLNVVPYITGNRPKIGFNVKLKNPKKHKIIGIQIDCDDPKPQSQYNSRNYGWYTENYNQEHYIPDLPRLGSGDCEYQYKLNIRIEERGEGSWSSMGLILETGQVIYKEALAVNIGKLTIALFFTVMGMVIQKYLGLF